MRPPDFPWPETALARSVLFTAQVMREAIAADSYESFRALSLDAPARFMEADRIAEDVKKGHIPRATFGPIADELSWSFTGDPALKALCPDQSKLASKVIGDDSASLTQVQYHLRYLLYRIKNNYKEHIEEEILRRVRDSQTTSDLRLLAVGYVTHLINEGYSRGYVSSQIEAVFFDRLLLRTGPGILSGLFRRFSGKKSKYVVTVGVNRVMLRHLRNLNLRVERSPRDLPSFVCEEVSRRYAVELQAGFIHEGFESLDPYSAARHILNLLRNIRAIATMSGAQASFEWSSDVFVYKQKAQSGEFIANTSVFRKQPVPTNPRSRALKSAGSYSKKLLSFPSDSRMRLTRSISTAVASHEASSVESRLTAYWNAIEVLFEAPDPGRARILHYVELLSPSICTRYVRRLISAVFSVIVVFYRSKLTRLLGRPEFALAGDQHTALAFVLMMPEHQQARADILEIVKDNPLACHRLWLLHKNFENPEMMMKTIISHEKRIQWQIHRIYRARNSIMHAGKTPSYLDSLALNLSEYYRTAMPAIPWPTPTLVVR